MVPALGMDSVAATAGLQAYELQRVAAVDGRFHEQHVSGGAERRLSLLHGGGANGTQGLTCFDGNGLAVDEQGG